MLQKNLFLKFLSRSKLMEDIIFEPNPSNKTYAYVSDKKTISTLKGHTIKSLGDLSMPQAFYKQYNNDLNIGGQMFHQFITCIDTYPNKIFSLTLQNNSFEIEYKE